MTEQASSPDLELARALVAFQSEAPKLTKDSFNPHFKSRFASLDSIVEAVGPLLAKHGLAWSALPSFDANGSPTLRYRLLHSSGGVLEGEMPLMLSKQDPQGQGSAITYARRYSIAAVLNLVAEEDDDAERAMRSARGTVTKREPAAIANAATAQPLVPTTQPMDVGEVISDADRAELTAAAKGLRVAQIKMALTSVGIPQPPPGRDLFSTTTRGKAALLAMALAETERE